MAIITSDYLLSLRDVAFHQIPPSGGRFCTLLSATDLRVTDSGLEHTKSPETLQAFAEHVSSRALKL